MMKTMCPPGYHHSGFMAADAVGLMIYVIYIELAKSIIYIYIYIYNFTFQDNMLHFLYGQRISRYRNLNCPICINAT